MVDVKEASINELEEELQRRKKGLSRVCVKRNSFIIPDIEFMKVKAIEYIEDSDVVVGNSDEDIGAYFGLNTWKDSIDE